MSVKTVERRAGSMDYAVDEDGNEAPIVKAEILFDGEEPI